MPWPGCHRPPIGPGSPPEVLLCHCLLDGEAYGAKFQYGPFKGITPTTILVPRKALTESATFQKEGFEERTVPVITGIQWITWLDIIAWQPFPI